MASLGDMVVRIVGDTTGFTKSLTETNKKMLAFGVNATAVIAVVAKIGQTVVKAAKEFSDYGSAIFDASEKTGLSTDAIQEWKFIAEQTGTTLESVTGAVGMMTRGLQTNAETFAKLGIELKNADGSFRSTTDIFNDTVATLSAMSDETERDQLAFKLLGRSAQSLIPILNAGASGIESMRDEAHRLGIVLDNEVITNADELGDATDALKAAFTAAKNNMINELAPALIKITNFLADQIAKTLDAKSAWEQLERAKKGEVQTESELNLALKAAVSETERLTKALAYRSQLDAETVRLMEQQLVDAKLLEDSIRKQVVAQASWAAATARGTAELKKRAEADAAAAAEAQRLAEEAAKREATRVEQEKLAIAAAEERIAAEVRLKQVISDGRAEIFEQIEEYEAKQVVVQRETMTKTLDGLADVRKGTLNTLTELGNAWESTFKNIESVTKPIFERLGEDLYKNELSWKSLGTVAINAIGGIVSALGDELAAKAAAATVEAFAALASVITAPLAPGLFARAGILAGGAGAAWAAGGALKAVQLADGGVVMPKSGGTLAQIAEAGQPEAVIPLDKLDMMGGEMRLIVNIDSRPILDKVFNATKNRTVLIDSGAVV